MGSKLYKVFEEVEVRARLLTKYWNNFYTEVAQHLPETYQPEMQELSNKLEQALEQLVSELRNPTLTLATAGTTSSGKSTLVNLLCGAEIVPVAVSEMSAGAVTIEYSEEKALVIHETLGAVWECGEWQGISEDEIYHRLEQVMLSYIDNREQQPNLACPQSIVRYPFRLLKAGKLDLPIRTKVRIMDLPGLAYVGDEGNASIIRQCREALCIVTYNSAETDRQKVRSLLQEVVEQVKDLGGSPARMLFVLNRIDVFRADRNWTETETRFVTNTVQSIKSELTDHLKEYTQEIENLKVVKLSAWPALLALQTQNNDEIYSAQACKKADNHFNSLIEEILEDLPRNPQKWSKHDRNRVADALWHKSYAEEFHQNLKEHITEHFPKLVIPQAVERFKIAAGNAVAEWAIQTPTAILNSSEGRYKVECENILKMKSELDILLQESSEEIREPLDTIAKKSVSDPNFLLDLEKAVLKVSDFYVKRAKKVIEAIEGQEIEISELHEKELKNRLRDKLSPLYMWERSLSKYRNEVLEAIIVSLKTGRINLDNLSFRKADRRHLILLENTLNKLIELGYKTSVAKNGETRTAVTDDEKQNLNQLNQELGQVSIHLSLVMEDILNQVMVQELNRMYDAMAELFRCYLHYIEQEAQNRFPALMIKFPKPELIQVKNPPSFKDFNFESSFKVGEKTWQEESRSFWHWLGLIPKVETRSGNTAEIPSAETLLQDWTTQARRAEPSMAKPIVNWLVEQIDHLKKAIDQIHADVINRYQSRLDKAYHELTLDYEKERNIWQPIQQKAFQLAEDFSVFTLENILKELKEEFFN